MLDALFGPPDPPVTLVSAKTLSDCLHELKAKVDSPWMPFGSKPVLGHIGASTLIARKRIGFSNSFQTRLTANISPTPRGVEIQCRFGMAPIVTAFMLIWFAGVVLIGGAMMILAIIALLSGHVSGPLGYPGLALFIVAPPLMICFGIGLVRFGRWLARDERQFLIDFVKVTLAAE